MITAITLGFLVWWHGDIDPQKRNFIMCQAAKAGGIAPEGTACVVPNGKTYKEGLWREPDGE